MQGEKKSFRMIRQKKHWLAVPLLFLGFGMGGTMTAAGESAQAAAADAAAEENLASKTQIAQTNVQNYTKVSDAKISWKTYRHVSVSSLAEGSSFEYQVKKFAAAYTKAAGQDMNVQLETDQVSADGDIRISVDENSSIAEEGYKIDFTEKNANVSAKTEAGAVYALTTIMDMVKGGQDAYLGTVTDAPDVQLREVSVDCGRKYYSKEWFLNLIDQMAEAKENNLVMHFSDKTGFMIESEKHPEVMSEQYLKKDEVREIIAYAKKNYITVTPELDMPGHLGQVLKAHQDLILKSTAAADASCIDVTNPAAAELLKSLVDEYADLFKDGGSAYFDIGCDEYLANDYTAAGLSHYPALVKAAKDKYGAEATGVESFYDFINDMDSYVKEKGYQARIFHDRIDRTDAKSLVKLNKDLIIKYWTHCRAQMPTLQTILDEGHQIMNYNDNYMYYVLGENAGYTYPVAQNIYENWNNAVYARIGKNQIGNAEPILQNLDPKNLPENALGSTMSIWSDNHDAQTEEQVAEKFAPAMKAFAQKAWGGAADLAYEDFAGGIEKMAAENPTQDELAAVEVEEPSAEASADNFADQMQAAQTNVKEYTKTSDQKLDWKKFSQVSVSSLEDGSSFAYQVKKFAAGYAKTTGQSLEIAAENEMTSADGSIRINIDADSTLADQGYQIDLSEKTVTITAKTQTGAVYALTTLADMAKSGQTAYQGTIKDAPDVEWREVSVDCGRKFYSKQWFIDLIDQMADAKQNSLVFHFSEKTGFTIESETHPEVVSEQHLSKQDVKDIIAYAKKNFISVTPELDMPGHLGQVLAQHPEYQLDQMDSATGKTAKNPQALDISNPEAIAFIKEIMDEYIDLFKGSSPYFDIGCDEFIDFNKFDPCYPALLAAAKEKYGEDAAGIEVYYDFINSMNDYLKTKGFNTRVWSDGILRKGQEAASDMLTRDVIVKYWTHWDLGMPAVQTLFDAGFKVINYNDNYLYYVLGQHNNYTYPEAQETYEGWNNGVYPSKKTETPQTYDPKALPENAVGSAISVWSDLPEEENEADVAQRLYPALKAQAHKAWGGATALSFEDYAAAVEKMPHVALTDKEIDAATVKQAGAEVPAESITLGAAGIQVVKAGKTLDLKPEVLPEEAADKAITYTFSKDGIAAVDENGVLTALKPGMVKVAAACGGKTAAVTVRVTQ